MLKKGDVIEVNEDQTWISGIPIGIYMVGEEGPYNSFKLVDYLYEVMEDWDEIGYVTKIDPCDENEQEASEEDADGVPTAFPTVFELIEDWAEERNLINGSDAKSQLVKLVEEVGELASDVAKGKCVKDSIGDSVVVLTILAAQYGTTLEECAWEAYNEIKDRKGVLKGGVFVKNEDMY